MVPIACQPFLFYAHPPLITDGLLNLFHWIQGRVTAPSQLHQNGHPNWAAHTELHWLELHPPLICNCETRTLLTEFIIARIHFNQLDWVVIRPFITRFIRCGVADGKGEGGGHCCVSRSRRRFSHNNNKNQPQSSQTKKKTKNKKSVTNNLESGINPQAIRR